MRGAIEQNNSNYIKYNTNEIGNGIRVYAINYETWNVQLLFL